MEKDPKPKHNEAPKVHWRKPLTTSGICLVIVLIAYTLYAAARPVIAGRTIIDRLDVSGLSRQQATAELQTVVKGLEERTINLVVEERSYPIVVADIGLHYDVSGAVEAAWNVGRGLNIFENFGELIGARFFGTDIPLPYSIDEGKLKDQISVIAQLVDQPPKDLRLSIENANVSILTDTNVGYVIDQPRAIEAALLTVSQKQTQTENQHFKKIIPQATLSSAQEAKDKAQLIIAKPLTLTYKDREFDIDEKQLGRWIQTTSKGTDLELAFDQAAISTYITTVADELNAEPQAPRVLVVDGKVTEFTAPTIGRRLDQQLTIEAIVSIMNERAKDAAQVDRLALLVSEEKAPVTDTNAQDLGIVELVGSASTLLTGSPPNRISNIKNGVKFLSGLLIKPGEEFSTLKSLGRIDNTTGYLPELVIKEDRTVPEFGGGLCQVSTTLFRALLNAGLPITARQNHSYRVSYYETDGNGKYMGPGLDATIYQPNPDLKFINDTQATLLIQGRVVGDRITFDIYGTRDGRVAVVDGPYKLSETPAGEPIYGETDTLAPGVKKQIERAHNGGTALATYTVTYPDGTVKEQEFKSFYRNWPARYLVGTESKPETPAPEAPAPNDAATPTTGT